MGAEIEKKKPKATLIKHRKPEIPSPKKTTGEAVSPKPEKKKVVVVKKKTGSKPAPRKPESVSPKSPKAVLSPPERSHEPEQGLAEQSANRKVTTSRANSEKVASGKDTFASPPRSASAGSSRGIQVLNTRRTGGLAGVVSGRRVDGGDRKRENRSAPARGKAPPVVRGNKPGNFTSPPPQQGRGPGAKKFYKAKKTYQKRKEESEKIYQFSKKNQAVQTNPIPKEIDIMEVLTVSELAKKMNIKASDLISKLMGMGMLVTINQQIDAETATILADEYKCKVNIVSLYDETLIESAADKEEDMSPRPPVVTVMGHVDHGKTKLLDAIRKTDVVAGEHGGITQHIGASMVHAEKGNLTFLDTPGHSAFTSMRARGAQVTDIVILVVAADDGVMPQTVEAIQHARAASTPIIVALTKMDLPDANPEKVRQQLAEYDLVPEAWGGSTQFVELSAVTGEGMDTLLETILLESEMLELKANRDCRAEGKVIESRLDHGRGIISTVLVERGVLRVGDAFLAGIFPGKVRAMFNDKGEHIKEGGPSMPVEILGFSGIPDAGDPFQVTESEKVARQYGNKRQELKKIENAKNVKKITLANLYDSMQEGDLQELKVIIKGDVHGSVEALQAALERLSTDEIKLTCIRSAAGAIIEDDINLAAASNAIILGFHVRPTAKAQTVADREKVEIRKYNIIYDVIEDIRSAMEGMLVPEYSEETLGSVEVREIFKVPKIGLIAGCMVSSGNVTRKSRVHVFRDGVQIHTGNLLSLKRFKEDVGEVKEGFECGIALEAFNDVRVGDVLEVFETRTVSKKLGEKNE